MKKGGKDPKISDNKRVIFLKIIRNMSQNSIHSNLISHSRVAVAKLLVRPPAKQEVSGSNLGSYLC